MGTKSPEVLSKLSILDKFIDTILTETKRHNLEDEVNLMIVSDHGMINVGPSFGTQIIKISEYLLPSDLFYYGDGGPYVTIWPSSLSSADVIYDKLLSKGPIKGLHVYKKADIPSKYHFKFNARIAPILLVADVGYIIEGFDELPGIDCGVHGYDPFLSKDMRAGFAAVGPAFRRNFRTKAFMQTDHYNVFCHVLGIKPQENNGSFARAAEFLANPSNPFANHAVDRSLSFEVAWIIALNCFIRFLF